MFANIYKYFKRLGFYGFCQKRNLILLGITPDGPFFIVGKQTNNKLYAYPIPAGFKKPRPAEPEAVIDFAIAYAVKYSVINRIVQQNNENNDEFVGRIYNRLPWTVGGLLFGEKCWW